MEWILEHWYTIALIVVFIAGGTLSVIRFAKMTKAERYEQIRAWLLQAVMFAEKEFGSGTGKLKLSNVYAKFCEQIPWLAKIIPFKTFSDYVDQALEEMKEIIESNAAIAAVIEPKEEN